MRKAFVLGAGLGTRLRPLTDILPKPLIPVLNRPLITHAFDHLLAAGVEEFIVNTHHLHHRFAEFFPDNRHAGAPITFVHESPEVLETGGGIANIAELVRDGDFIVYNGDILTDLPLQQLLESHRASNNLVTLALRSTGAVRNVAWDAATGKIRDLRNALGTGAAELFQFAGIYVVSPEFLPFLRPVKESIVPAWLKLITEHDQLGGVLLDEGHWHDLGDRDSYVEASIELASAGRIHPGAVVDPAAEIDAVSTVGAGAIVGPGARIRESIVWPGVEIAPGASLHRCVAGSGRIEGVHSHSSLALAPAKV